MHQRAVLEASWTELVEGGINMKLLPIDFGLSRAIRTSRERIVTSNAFLDESHRVGITAAWSAADPTDPLRILQTIYGYFRSFMDPSNPSAHSAEATASAVVSAGRQQSNRNVDK